MTLYFNASEGPIRINEEGTTVGGGEWFKSDLTDEIRAGISRNEVVTIPSNVADKFDHIPLSYDSDAYDEDEPQA